jgi:hypothetical protein
VLAGKVLGPLQHLPKTLQRIALKTALRRDFNSEAYSCTSLDQYP